MSGPVDSTNLGETSSRAVVRSGRTSSMRGSAMPAPVVGGRDKASGLARPRRRGFGYSPGGRF